MNTTVYQSARRIVLAVFLFGGVIGIGVLGWFVLFENDHRQAIQNAALTKSTPSLHRIFDYRLYGRFAELHANENFAVSPFAVRLALGLLISGAADTTKEQMTNLLEPLDSNTLLVLRRQLPELEIANRIWVQREQNLLDGYLKFSNQFYGVMPGLVNFHSDTEGARVKINRWSAEKTSGTIDNILPPGVIDGLTQLILTSAARFRGIWPRQLRSQEGDFSPGKGTQLKTDFLEINGELLYAQDKEAQVVELPFDGDEISLVVLLPNGVAALQSVESRLNSAYLQNWLSRLKATRISVLLPRLKISRTLALPVVLNGLGMVDAFDPLQADFSGITGKKDLFLGAVIHRSKFALSEEGALTAEPPLSSLTLRHSPVVFHADHPFIFLIRHKKTNTILFMGHMADPRE